MNGSQGGGGGRWKFLKGRLGLKGMGCCGGVWGLGASSNMTVREEDDDDDRQGLNLQEQRMIVGQIPADNNIMDLSCVDHHQVVVPPVASGINLAMALAAERHFRAARDWVDDGGAIVGPSGSTATATSGSSVAGGGGGVGTPLRVSLMRLLEEGEGLDGAEEEEETEGGGGEKGRGVGNDTMCCVCMGRRKGAAFIPCGHTFCRVCSRELWLNRGSCPLCNRSILEILDIF
ncbi:zinc finger protein [Macleaya cordata]|uniref:Zinc finger protein n=1 Tax=Macleaya cordata TaxID=56857 RepID=A0A200RBG4_MACCD|nr:zinc finger protein [Macleaya cordata]